MKINIFHRDMLKTCQECFEALRGLLHEHNPPLRKDNATARYEDDFPSL